MIYNKEITINETDTVPRYDILDSHLHFLDFTQDSDGFPALVKAMDLCGVSEAVVFGMPMVKKWDYLMKDKPAYYLSNDNPFCCGFDCTDKYAATQIERLLKMYPDFWCGIGELMSRHDDLTALTYGEGVHMDSPAFKMIYDLAADYDLPVLVHHNISPQNSDKPLYEDELIRALEHNRKCKIIWAHVGVSRRIVMDFFENYVRGDLMRGNVNTDIFADMWAAVIEKYPDRFMIGSDKVGHWADYPHEIEKYYMLLDKLKPETAEKLCRKNALSLIKKRGVFE